MIWRVDLYRYIQIYKKNKRRINNNQQASTWQVKSIDDCKWEMLLLQMMEAVKIHPPSRHLDCIGEIPIYPRNRLTSVGLCVRKSSMEQKALASEMSTTKMLQLYYRRTLVTRRNLCQGTYRESPSPTVSQISNHNMLEILLIWNSWKQGC